MFTTVFFPLFLVFFLVAFLPSIVTWFGLMEKEMEMELNGYHRLWGCIITLWWLVVGKALLIAGSCT